MKKKTFASIVAGLLAFGLLVGCFGGESAQSPSPSPSEEVAEPSADTEKAVINVAMLNGPTGMGAAKLMADDEAGTAENDYEFTVYTDNNEVVNALANGDVDIAALATNVASNLYHKTDGGIQLIAINTYGVLKILQGGENADITDMSQLAGQTVYATGQGANPEYVLNYLLTENGLDPANDVDIQWMTAQEVTQGIISGAAEFAMLPVPAATTACIQSEGTVRQALDLTEQWDAVSQDSKLTMGCVVVRTAFAEESPELVRSFLREYQASIEYMSDPENLALSSELAPAQLLEKYGIVPKAAVAMKALPQANLTFVSGVKDLRDTIQGYYEVLYAADPTSIGGSIPDDAFYFE